MAPVIEHSNPCLLHPDPLISIYMASYNQAEHLATAVESVACQSFSGGMELVIGEDCSTDGALGVAMQLQARHPALIRVLTGPANIGGPANLSRALVRMRGRYIAYCEGDDFWTDPTKLERQFDFMERHPGMMLSCHSAVIVSRDGLPTGRTARPALASRELSVQELILGDGGMVPTVSMMARRELYDSRPAWWTDCPVGDFPTVLCAASRGTVGYIDRIMAAYRTGVEGSWTWRTMRHFDARWRHAEAIETMLLGFLDATDGVYEGPIRRMISKYYSNVLVALPRSSTDQQAYLERVQDRLTADDALLVRLAPRLGRTAVLVKSTLRKARTLLRKGWHEITQKRLA